MLSSGSESQKVVMTLPSPGYHMSHPSIPLSDGLSPVSMDVVVATVVAGNTEVIDLKR